VADSFSCLLYTARGRFASSVPHGEIVTSYRLSLSLAALVSVVTACSQPETVKQATRAFELVETYGDTSPRSVSLRASWGNSPGQTIELVDVSVTLAPGAQPMVQKLETLLEETDFRWQPGEARWPEPTRSAPPDAVPMISRIQLALLLQEGPESFEVVQPIVNLFSTPPTMGLMRLERRGAVVLQSTIALIMTPEGGVFAWSHSKGTIEGSEVHLSGTRQIDGAPGEPVSTTIRAVQVQPSPLPR
jgi:hypothetical protein